MQGQEKAEQNVPRPASFDAAIAEAKKQRESGHFSEAADIFLQAARIAHAAGDTTHEAKALQSASGSQIFAFQYRAALQSAENAYALAMSAKAPAIAGAAAGNLATVYIEAGDLAQARLEAQEAVRILEQSPRQDLLAQALVALAGVDLRLPGNTEIQSVLDRAIPLAQTLKLPSIEAMAWELVGLSAMFDSSARPQNLDRAQQSFEKAASIYSQVKDPDAAFTDEYLAELALKRQNYPEALRLMDLARAAHSARFDSSPRFYPTHVRAQILLGLGRRAEALNQFKTAVDYADRFWDAALPGDITSTQTVASLHDVYQDYVSLAADEAVRTHNSVLSRQAFEALASNRAASLRQQLTLTFAQNFRLPPQYFDLVSKLQDLQAKVTLGQTSKDVRAQLQQTRLQLGRLENQIGLTPQKSLRKNENSTHRTPLKDIQTRLNDSEALLSFSLGVKQSYLWAITRDRVNLYTLAAKSEIENQAKAFSKTVASGENNPIIAGDFSKSLFGKVDEAVSMKPNWLVVGDGGLLDSVPFSALPDSKNGGSLIDQHSLRFLPSEILIASRTPDKNPGGFLGVADPIYNLADSRATHDVKLVPASSRPAVNLARLAGSNREIQMAATDSGLPQTKILSGAAATSVQLNSALADKPEVVHFAVHVVSPEGRPQEAALALSLTRDSLPELLTSEVIASYRVPGSLIVLSGCASQQGETLPSAGLIGLSRAWLLAGASAVVVSAWPTPDDSGRFFSSFYKHLNSTQIKKTNKALSIAERASVALKEAQQDMRRGSDYWSAPKFWAAYSVISKE